jgi:hypothetical protein
MKIYSLDNAVANHGLYIEEIPSPLNPSMIIYVLKSFYTGRILYKSTVKSRVEQQADSMLRDLGLYYKQEENYKNYMNSPFFIEMGPNLSPNYGSGLK